MRTRTTVAILLSMLAVGSCSSPTEGPGPNTPATVAVEPSTALLVSLGDTVVLSATVRNGSSRSIAAAVTWASDAPGVASVDDAGRVIAHDNGTASVTASSGGVSGSATVTVEQVAATVEASGDSQGGEVVAPLDSTIVVTLLDARGNPVAGAPVSFTVASGDGAVDPASADTDAEGEASATWTLGPTAGIQELDVEGGFAGEASRRLTATGYALEAFTMALHSGDGQSELAEYPLAEPLRVQVLDSLGNGVPDVYVTFAADGDATLDATETFTDLDGIASVGLTLGTSLGPYSATAAVPDSMTVSNLPLAGSPVTFDAEALTFDLAPAAGLTVGDTVTLTGTGFHPEPTSNTVTLGGASVTVLEGTQSGLTVEVPGFGCTPQRGMDLVVSRDGGAETQAVTLTPADALALDVGDRVILSDADDLCVQLPPGTDDEYLIGLTSTSWFDGGASVRFDGVDSLGPFPAPTQMRAAATTDGLADGGSDGRLVRFGERFQDLLSTASIRRGEATLRAFEEDLVSDLGVAAGPPAPAPPMEGDQLDLRLPDLNGDPCLDYVPVSAEVFSVGARLALASSEPLPGPLDPQLAILLNAANTLHAEFGDTGVNLIMGLLGVPAGWSADSRVTVVLTPAVAAMGVPVYASAVDQLPRAICPSSDEGHYVYAQIPDAATVAQLAAVLAAAPADLTHEIAHIVQWTRRLTEGGNLLPSWLAEGQAEIVVEHVGLTLSGLGSRQDLGSSVLGLPGVGARISERFDRLALYHGWDGAAGTVDGAPEQCSLFGFGGSVCESEAAPGAAWSFVRYLSDRFGPGSVDGEPGLHQAIIDLEPTGDVVGQLEDLLAAELPELVVDWAATLYTDGRLTPAQAPLLQMPSWQLLEMIPAGPRRLAPTTFDFVDFDRSTTVVGGGTAYTLVSSPGAHSSLAIKVDDGVGGAIPEVMRPRVWVVRMR